MNLKRRGKEVLDHKEVFRELCNSIKWNSIHIIGVPEEEEQEKGAEGLFEPIIAENFPNLGKETDIQVQEAQRTSIKFNKSQPSWRHSQIHKILRQEETPESSKKKKNP